MPKNKTELTERESLLIHDAIMESNWDELYKRVGMIVDERTASLMKILQDAPMHLHTGTRYMDDQEEKDVVFDFIVKCEKLWKKLHGKH